SAGPAGGGRRRCGTGDAMNPVRRTPPARRTQAPARRTQDLARRTKGPVRRTKGPAIPVFLYHAVTDDPPEWIAEFTVAPKEFAAHLDAVVDSGRTPVTISTLAAHLAGRAPLPARPVL